MLTVSASRLKLYQECRLRYYRRYILGIKGQENTSALMGSAIHKAIEYYYTKKKDPIVTFTRYMQCMNDWYFKRGQEIKEYEPFSQLLTTGKQILTTFPFEAYEPIEQELSFTLPFTPQTNIHGFIDLVLPMAFVDFKSAKRKPKDLQNDIQFAIYAYAHTEIYGSLPEYGVWHHLRTNEQLRYEISAETVEKNIQRIKLLADELANDTFEDVTACKNCPNWCITERNNANI